MSHFTPIHFTAAYLLNPTNPITVNLIGVGGTGSAMLTCLAKLNHSLLAMGHCGLQVSVFDDDLITEFNQGRQLFADCEVGLYKSVVLVNRINRFFGTNWKAIPEKYGRLTSENSHPNTLANIVISCVDTVKARFEIADLLKNAIEQKCEKVFYWMDCGNGQYTGQVILSTVNLLKQPESKLYQTVAKLPMVTDEFVDLLLAQDETQSPSCSTAEALEKQDLFINATIADLASTILWHLFSKGMLASRGCFVNLDTMHTAAINLA